MRKITGICLVVMLVASAAHAAYKDDIGYSRLQSALGSAVPNGTNVAVTQVEGQVGAGYMPDTNHVELAGKRIDNVTATPTNASGHATYVAQHFYGRTTSTAPAVNNCDVYLADLWFGSSFLNTFGSSAPGIETNSVQNHSWTSFQDPAVVTDMVQRLDYAIDRDGFICVSGLNNETGSVPHLVAHIYNGISVGVSDGSHSYGTTTLDGPGRIKPELVAPSDETSWATPMVSAAAALLIQHARDNPALINALKPQCVKALLMAGATKQEFSGWDRTHSRPLDDVYGAGELNIYNSYFMLDEGEQPPGSASNVALMGWDYGAVSPAATSRYFFAVEEGKAAIRMSALLAWNRGVTDGPGAGFDPVGQTPANLDLRLYSATGFVAGVLFDWSTSTVDNVEHIYVPGLREGQYVFEVVSDSPTNYAFAWNSEVIDVPELGDPGWTNDCVKFLMNVTTTYTYRVEATTNLLDPAGWTQIFTSAIPASPYLYTDTASTNFLRRYYRVLLHDVP